MKFSTKVSFKGQRHYLRQIKLQLDSYILYTIQNAKLFQQPNHKNNYNNRIKNIFNGALHGNVAVYQPKYNSNNQDDNDNS